MGANVLAAMDFHPPYHCDDSGVGNLLQNPYPTKPGPAQKLLKSSHSFIIWIEVTEDILLLLGMHRDCVLTHELHHDISFHCAMTQPQGNSPCLLVDRANCGKSLLRARYSAIALSW